MDEQARELLAALVNRVLRHPEEAKDIDAQRAVQRLVAARADAPYLLLQRALVLEVALAQVHAEIARLRGGAAIAANDPGMPASTPADSADSAARAAAALPSRGFLRDAAAISAGVLGGNLLVAAATALFDDDAHDTGADFDPGDLI
ncbi:MAG: DUF2076 family protein [Rhodocyclaceae bacterium]|nr:DUF2076 family protein [Rhodocyclaceae bacterium]MCA3074092.1 DUF2076 family protein [Rhodocyclaceae bacterium]MCA3090978.1 DUF2076 family protein [Rhodocyclaceae bacterium]MCA3094986.1 DUF2076 family protein [Rhodocyclaceae bacterium]MCA3099329.1 DUF2076 family protein [Rhodocyclaceae bacterium]